MRWMLNITYSNVNFDVSKIVIFQTYYKHLIYILSGKATAYSTLRNKYKILIISSLHTMSYKNKIRLNLIILTSQELISSRYTVVFKQMQRGVIE